MCFDDVHDAIDGDFAAIPQENVEFTGFFWNYWIGVLFKKDLKSAAKVGD
jgi:hypothetical protein